MTACDVERLLGSGKISTFPGTVKEEQQGAKAHGVPGPSGLGQAEDTFWVSKQGTQLLPFLPLTQEGTCSWVCLFGSLTWFVLFVLLTSSYIKKDSENKLNRGIYREM